MTATADRRAAVHADTRLDAVPPSSRVSLLVGESHQIDLLLPAAVPLAKLADPTRDAINRQLRTIGAEELPGRNFVFARAAGMTMLAGNLSLSAQGVTDADLLAFVPAASAQRYEPNIENVSAAIAKWAKGHFPAVSAGDAAAVAVALTTVAVVVSGLLVWRQRWATAGGWLTPAIFGVAGLVLIGVAALAARMAAPAATGTAACWCAVVGLVAAGACAPPGRHPGAPQAFLAAGVALVATGVMSRFTSRYQAARAAVITVSVAVLGVAAARMFFEVPGRRIATVMLIAVLTVSLAAPAIGRQLARVPRQSFDSITGKDMYTRAPGEPEDTITPVADAPHDITLRGEQLAEVARRSNRVLTGLLLGNALVQVASTWAVIDPGAGSQWPFVVVAATVAVILVLRARAFRDRRHAITVVVGAALSLFAIPVHYGIAADAASATGLWAGAAVLGIAVCALLGGTVIPSRTFSEPVRELVEYAEYVATTAVVVFAAWAIDLLHFVRYH
jgi:type VII secretion integral membrane protein EccD